MFWAKKATSKNAKSVYLPQTVSIPVPLFKSLQGKYFLAMPTTWNSPVKESAPGGACLIPKVRE